MLFYLFAFSEYKRLLSNVALFQFLYFLFYHTDFLVNLYVLSLINNHFVLLLQLLNLIIQIMQHFFAILKFHIHSFILSLFTRHSRTFFRFNVINKIHSIVIYLLKDRLERTLLFNHKLFVLFFIIYVV